MRIDHCPPAETATRIFSVKHDLIRFQAEDFGNRHLVHRLKLRGHPRLSLVAFKSDRRVQGFHRRVGQIREFIFGHDSPGRRYAIDRFVIAASHRNTAWSASQRLVFRPQL